jgi:hypothetical protein
MRIQLSGQNLGGVGGSANGLSLADHVGSTVRGLVINNFGLGGIRLGNGGGHRIQGNFIGTSAGGGTINATGPGIEIGLYVLNSGNNLFGTDGDGANDFGERNVIAGFGNSGGILIQNSGSSGNIIAGNYIGTNAQASNNVPNTGSGIVLDTGVQNTRIGTDGSNDAFNANERNRHFRQRRKRHPAARCGQ